MDVFSKQKRSEIMSKIRSKDTKIEILFRKALWKKGFRYIKNSNKYFGKPDIILPKYKTVIFIDSCFWHNCPKHGYLPKSNLRYWRKKIEHNKERDKEVRKHYKKISWKIFRIWEHEFNKKDVKIIIDKLKSQLH
ncbi:very short patch repair endonuclease [Candidatus Wolfebacteria bacterium CG_4_10_14_0_8_um_filter_37_11]|uniref:Very short patch repair endonuclease n=1 Tax=Candidatus Wolfebacteria bacterium CG_4_10_14_0_8_um_filter_37_11 TaxID=1975062 RepID=A0A2M7Q8C7_9BACT|nr:MAG: very short patch repair endonuclease [Candidatus Berkelbacteria bacterium CG10_big_fil_rev_8_21_14_0_10_33_10]PIY59707.1 MAG: very short patch repair endonuclease [Candidatus Wolfebacteria bacterium CG_4_10_14_0_8_um_filter_37_11]PJA84263.1 MAG: very short patch repair endonuclease [Candidatus Nealsonbacteria bacterium CG_4_9_14_3_um_filter_35_11]